METIQSKNCVLDRNAIDRKIKRMALQVAEHNIDEKEIVIAGIEGNGEVVSKCLIQELQKISTVNIEYMVIRLNKKNPVDVVLEPSINTDNKTVLLVDDVANTGKTLLYALKPFLNVHPKKIQTLVLVERSHKLFPVQTDYTGLSISTTLQEHIIVESNNGTLTGAWLF
jgi:pyrimidine operon attenuation protein/uracil phosphoribosyltransferase